MAIAQEVIDRVALQGTYTFNVNPIQILPNDVGLDGYQGGGNYMVGVSATDLQKLLDHLERLPHAIFELDNGLVYADFLPATREDVRRLRDAFFKLYGWNKPNYYGPPLTLADQNP